MRTKPKRQPPYAVILFNDDINGFDFVVGVLRKVFHYGLVKAFKLTITAHPRDEALFGPGRWRWQNSRPIKSVPAVPILREKPRGI